MAKITTVIDIGSNSMRMVVFEKTSRFGFHLIKETKSRVKISEGCYENDGNLQKIPMQRAFDALASFIQIAKTLKSNKILCVATSALRDAPNAKEFTSKVSQQLGLNIKIIDGVKESYFGGIAAINLLHQKDFISIDIGGGSTELCLCQNGKLIENISLNIGTVRLKELYFNKANIQGAKELILSQLASLETFKTSNITTLVGIGGTARALSRAIIKKEKYPFDVLHGFEYSYSKYQNFLSKIIEAKNEDILEDCYIKPDRYDTICEGTFIFQTICEYFDIQKVLTSGVGVREGVYLSDLLRSQNHKFPANFNPSVRSLLDRFDISEKITAHLGQNGSLIFDALKPLHNLNEKYKKELVIASKLYMIGVSLNFYKHSFHAFNFILNGLDYGFSHKQRALIANIIRYSRKSLPKFTDVSEFGILLPELRTIEWLSFMISLNVALIEDGYLEKYHFELDKQTLTITSQKHLYLAKAIVNSLEKPDDICIHLVQQN